MREENSATIYPRCLSLDVRSLRLALALPGPGCLDIQYPCLISSMQYERVRAAYVVEFTIVKDTV